MCSFAEAEHFHAEETLALVVLRREAAGDVCGQLVCCCGDVAYARGPDAGATHRFYDLAAAVSNASICSVFNAPGTSLPFWNTSPGVPVMDRRSAT